MNSIKNRLERYLDPGEGSFAYRFASRLARFILIQFLIFWVFGIGSAHLVVVSIVVVEYSKEVAILKLPQLRCLGVMMLISCFESGLTAAIGLSYLFAGETPLNAERVIEGIVFHSLAGALIAMFSGVVGIASHLDKPSE